MGAGKKRETVEGASADVMLYQSFDALVADSEVVAIGTVKEVIPFCDEYGSIHSDVVIDIEHLIKGEAEGTTLTYITIGGRMPWSEWLKNEANAAMIKEKESPEAYEQAVAAAKPEDVVESLFMMVKNPEPGDKLLVFLRFDIMDNEDYRMQVTPYNGQFFYDAETDTYYKTNDFETMRIDLSELKKLAETTPDNSAYLRAADEENYRQHLAELENPPPDDGEPNWDEITPRVPNPDYDKDGT